MKHSVELEYEVVDKLIVESLLNYVDYMLEDPWGPYHSYIKTLQDVSGFLVVLRVYTTTKEFEEILSNRLEKLKALLTKVKEST